jgi:NitT/TauT family transport system substrate-binding protein
MSVMSADTPAGKAARQHMAAASGTDLAGYEAQLAATRMFYAASDAVAFATSAALPTTMTKVAQFSFKHGLLGEGARSAEAVGMGFAKSTIGDAKNLKLRFDPSFMKMAADGKLN